MSAPIQDEVVAIAKGIHKRLWISGSNVSQQTKSAQAVCRAWQAEVKGRYLGRFSAEQLVKEQSEERIDLVDLQAAVAYELKASENNTHFEFYRDIFKVIVYNESHSQQKITKLVFITPKKGAAKVSTDYAQAVCGIVKDKHNIIAEVCGI